MVRTLVALAALVIPGVASAQEAVDIGVIKQSDVRVVQKLLYPKTGRTEMGMHLGWMPFDAYTTTPNGQLGFDLHQSESFAISVLAGGGWGLKTGTYRELESPTYGVAVDAYRYIGSGLAGIQWSPIYEKMNLNGANILHYDVYGTARAGASLESSLIPAGGVSISPTVSLGIGTRFFTGETGAVRFEIRDDFLVQRRALTASTHLKQNVDVTIGYSILSKVKGPRG